MQVENNDYFTEIGGIDEYGEFKLCIQNDCSQIRLECDNGEAYINVDYAELKTIRDSITQVLDKYAKNNFN